ncbi:MAG: bifunctional diguanylate cyclase/phosphohydrolase [Bacillota bacterium]
MEAQTQVSLKITLGSGEIPEQIKKWAIFFFGLFALWVLHPEAYRQYWTVQAIILIGIMNIAVMLGSRFYSWETNCWQRYCSFSIDVFFVAVLIASTGGLTSEFVLVYPVVMAGVATRQLTAKEFLLMGLTGHLSYVIALRWYYGELGFYLFPAFWVQCLLITGVFAGVMVTVNIIQTAISKLHKANTDLEKTTVILTEANQKLSQLALTDGLTGLYNHRYFQERIREELNRAERYESELSLMMLDVDHFKLYNDHCGHTQGDQVLTKLAQIISQSIRQVDVAARYGGEEFVVILVETDPIVATAVAERIRSAVEQYQFPGAESQPLGKVTVSIGIAGYPVDATEAHELINKADQALYRAKNISRNKVEVFASVLEPLYEAMNEANDNTNPEDLMEAIRSILSVINARDKYTQGHAEKTMKYSVALANKMGLASDRIRIIKYAAFLHDIGKLKIGKDILNKSRPLSDEEKDLIKLHSLYGVNIIEPLENVKDLIPVIRHHHERYDGKGYPDGLKSHAISLEARIMAVADSYDAMRSSRPYRVALSKEEALRELEDCAGSQFDPEVINAFVEMVQKGEIAEADYYM